MTRTNSKYSICVLILLFVGIFNSTSQKKPNILFILVDNLGYGELGCYGGGATRGAATPRIDKLASEGMRFTNMNTEPQCTPSRSSILTGRFAIRSGTYAVPIGGAADGLTRWELTLGETLSSQGYATAYYGKWHLGSQEGRFPSDQGFDEWYGIPRTTDEALWPGSTGYSENIMESEKIMEGKKGSKSKEIKVYDIEQRRLIDAEITRRSIEYIKNNSKSSKPFFVFAALTQPHLPTLPNPSFVGKTGNGDWADMLTEMDYNIGSMLDEIKNLGIEDNTLVIFLSDNGPEFLKPWDGWAGPWKGQYFTAWEGGIRVPMIVRWPGHIPSGKVTNEIVHGVDMFSTLNTIGGGIIPSDRPIDGIDVSPLWLGKSEKSGREGFPIWVSDRLQAVKWRNFKVHFYNQENMISPPVKLGIPMLFDLYANPQEDPQKTLPLSWVFGPMLKTVGEFEKSIKTAPLIPMGTPEPYEPKNNDKK